MRGIQTRGGGGSSQGLLADNENRPALDTAAHRLKSVFEIDVESCPISGGLSKVTESIEYPLFTQRTLWGLASKARQTPGWKSMGRRLGARL